MPNSAEKSRARSSERDDTPTRGAESSRRRSPITEREMSPVPTTPQPRCPLIFRCPLCAPSPSAALRCRASFGEVALHLRQVLVDIQEEDDHSEQDRADERQPQHEEDLA